MSVWNEFAMFWRQSLLVSLKNDVMSDAAVVFIITSVHVDGGRDCLKYVGNSFGDDTANCLRCYYFQSL